jgi:hypothetical protein
MQSLHPLYLGIGNISAEIRCKQSYHAFVLLGLLPLPAFKNVDATELTTLLTSRIHHFCLDYILSPLKASATSGVPLRDPDGVIHMCHTVLASYTADLPEARKIACVMQNASPVTLASGHSLGRCRTASSKTWVRHYSPDNRGCCEC